MRSRTSKRRASGSSKNAMLKAQMLATSLEVYFSDPSLRGNAMGAPAPIGGVQAELRHVCSKIGSTGACPSCEGALVDVSAAFGGADSMTVLKIPNDASGESNAGGSFWYANVKPTQALAKDMFDAVNNQVVFAMEP